MQTPAMFLRLVLGHILILTCFLFSVEAQSFHESLLALNSIGSHFGLPGNATFDYVVVGGGTAGLALARRLAQDANTTVAVVEAGSFYELDNGNRSTIPGYASYGSGNNPASSIINGKIDWQQYTSPQLVSPSGLVLGIG